MKKSVFWCLLLICCTCIAFTGGFFLGRNQNFVAVEVTHSPAHAEVPGKVNINTADAALLQTLPGIHEELANRIILYRQAHGSFATVGDLVQVEGIGTELLRDILDYITTGG
ncbi:MAG: helix-hairpin-helix domain-containing protein [Oscillospiraceae bacterium]|nr:helix-hairpin-helix domain-containing protein [Oscillospiraceae bacterium]